MNRSLRSGFTLVEIMIVIIVISILATISVMSYRSVQDRAKTSSGQTLATQVSEKAKTFQKLRSSFPSDAQLRSSSPLVPEARLDDSSDVVSPSSLTAQRSKATYDEGRKVAYRYVSSSIACVIYWDYREDIHKVILLGSAHSSCT